MRTFGPIEKTSIGGRVFNQTTFEVLTSDRTFVRATLVFVSVHGPVVGYENPLLGCFVIRELKPCFFWG